MNLVMQQHEVIRLIKSDKLRQACTACTRMGVDVAEEREVVQLSERLAARKEPLTPVYHNLFNHYRNAVVESLIDKIDTL